MKFWLEMSVKYGLPVNRIVRICRTANHCYKIYDIPKKSGGFRTICHPSRKIKVLQRILISEILDQVPVHSLATAYERNCSIKYNAIAHIHSNYFLKLDIAKYFESFSHVDVMNFLRHVSVGRLDDEDFGMAADVSCYNGRLTIGGPISPKITNRMMYDFDTVIAEYCAGHDLKYTRYADDMIFSGEEKFLVSDVISVVKKSFTSSKYGILVVNEDKTKAMSRKSHIRMTGLNITNDRRVVVSREDKRKIRVKLHHYESLTQDEKTSLAGKIAYIDSIEYGYKNKILMKYPVSLK